MKTSERKRAWVVLILAFLLFIVYSAVGERGFLQLSAMMRERDDLQNRVEELQRENDRLGVRIDLLRNDPGTIEEVARTELGMVREGETVYILPEETGNGQP